MARTAASAGPAWTPATLAVADEAPLRPNIMAPLLLLLPLFGQSFHYVKDLLPLWAMSKAFPVMSLPLMLVLLRRPLLPMTRQVLITFAWCVLVPSITAISYFDQDFFTGIAAQVKMLPLLYYYSFLGLLFVLRPTLKELAMGFLVWGLATYVSLILMWALVPKTWYIDGYAFGSSPLFSADSRGERIRMPMYFGMITLFYSYRRYLCGHGARWLGGALLGVLLTLFVVKTRAMMVGIAGVVALNSFRAANPRLRVLLLLLIPLAVAGLFSFTYLDSMFSTSASSGFDVRWVTAEKAVEFLGLTPDRWIFGVGTISPTSQDSLFAFFGHFFFLADITWLGIVFEYGVVGALLILLYEVRGLLFYRRLKRQIDDCFLGGLNDYIIYVLLISNLYPPTLSPGETAIILAIFVYVWFRLRTEAPPTANEAPA